MDGSHDVGIELKAPCGDELHDLCVLVCAALGQARVEGAGSRRLVGDGVIARALDHAHPAHTGEARHDEGKALHHRRRCGMARLSERSGEQRTGGAIEQTALVQRAHVSADILRGRPGLVTPAQALRIAGVALAVPRVGRAGPKDELQVVFVRALDKDTQVVGGQPVVLPHERNVVAARRRKARGKPLEKVVRCARDHLDADVAVARALEHRRGTVV